MVAQPRLVVERSSQWRRILRVGLAVVGLAAFTAVTYWQTAAYEPRRTAALNGGLAVAIAVLGIRAPKLRPNDGQGDNPDLTPEQHQAAFKASRRGLPPSDPVVLVEATRLAQARAEWAKTLPRFSMILLVIIAGYAVMIDLGEYSGAGGLVLALVLEVWYVWCWRRAPARYALLQRAQTTASRDN